MRSNLDEEAEVHIAAGLSTANPPVFSRDFSQQNLHVVAWNPERFEVLDDAPIELALRVQGPTRERIDTDVGIRFRVGPIRRTRKPMGRVNDQSDVSVTGQDLEGVTKGRMDRFDDSLLLLLAVFPSDLDKHAWHGDVFPERYRGWRYNTLLRERR
jgi:hypothetical protein